MTANSFTPRIITILISVIALSLVGAAWYYEENKTEDPATSSAATNTSGTDGTLESYTACGCGCCVGDDIEPEETCLDRDAGLTLEEVKTRDEEQKNNPECANMGCFYPVEYTYCDETEINTNTAAETTEDCFARYQDDERLSGAFEPGDTECEITDPEACPCWDGTVNVCIPQRNCL